MDITEVSSISTKSGMNTEALRVLKETADQFKAEKILLLNSYR